jgi:hypothetical protein
MTRSQLRQTPRCERCASWHGKISHLCCILCVCDPRSSYYTRVRKDEDAPPTYLTSQAGTEQSGHQTRNHVHVFMWHTVCTLQRWLVIITATYVSWYTPRRAAQVRRGARDGPISVEGSLIRDTICGIMTSSHDTNLVATCSKWFHRIWAKNGVGFSTVAVS